MLSTVVEKIKSNRLNTTVRNDYDYNYSYVFYFERKFYVDEYISEGFEWLEDYWWLSIVYSIIYIILVHAGQTYMIKREKVHLYQSLVTWNILLALFSIAGTLRFLPSFIAILYNRGFEHSICVFDYSYGVAGCWACMFGLSKVAELVDTVFIVMRKQKLIFLHWYHHATVLIYCWYSMKSQASTSRWFIAMNYTIHSLMYSYYACRALRFTIPKFVNIFITTLQILQMLIGILINLVAYFKKERGERCDVSYDNIYLLLFLCFTYFLLFFNFFINAYVKKSMVIKKSDNDAKKIE